MYTPRFCVKATLLTIIILTIIDPNVALAFIEMLAQIL